MLSDAPENVGERLLPSLIDEIAKSDPERVFFSIAKTKNVEDGFHDISARAFARAVDRCSQYIERTLGRGNDFPTLTYMGPQDIMYAVMTLACIKTGYKLLLNSPRNTLEAHLSLFDKTNCAVFLLPPDFPLPIIQDILNSRSMRIVEIAPIWHWLEDGAEESYPYTKTFAEAKQEPFVVLHTSGSTGMAKPITQTHETLAPLDATSILPSLGHQSAFPAMCKGKRVYLGFPLFHCAGHSILVPASIYLGFTVVLGPFPLSAEVVDSVHAHGNVQLSCLPPTILVDLANNKDYLNNLARLEFISYAGGPCPQGTGDLIGTKTRLFNCVGTTEGSYMPSELCDPEDWAYSKFSPLLGHEYRHVSADLYEQVIVRRPESRLFQGIFGTFPDLTEYPMKDLYSKHPTKENVWLYRGRADDTIVLSTGEKFNPLEIESAICSHPTVKAALVAGFGRFQSALLVEASEPPVDDMEREQIIDKIWPSVQAANKASPPYARIHKDMIIFTWPEKPMPRAGKGTVQRKLAMDRYADELDALYKSREQRSSGFERKRVKVNGNTHQESTQDIVIRIVGTCMEIDIHRLALDADLFELGLDSLQVTLISRRLNEVLVTRRKQPSMEPRIVYSNPSISSLTVAFAELVEGNTILQDLENNQKIMQDLYESHAEDMPFNARLFDTRSPGDETVLLTGSTGSLGSYILDSLSKNHTISRIYSLNRGPESKSRQQKSMIDKGLQILDDKVVFLEADFSKPRFGLAKDEYRKLLSEVTIVIHNAWKVDFNLCIRSFSNHIATVRKMIDFSVLSRFNACIFFISTPAAVSGQMEANDALERIYDGWDTPQAIGYGESKFVSELLLDKAAREANVPVVICRVGQIAGPSTKTGMWPKQEWLPSIIASSKYLGKIPDSLRKMDIVDWVPVDTAGQTIVELATSHVETTTGAVVLHVSNPQKTTWIELVPHVRGYLGNEVIELVPLDEWVNLLREKAQSSENIADNPALKLLDFYADLVIDERRAGSLDLTNAIEKSQTLASLEAIQGDLMINWMEQWGF